MEGFIMLSKNEIEKLPSGAGVYCFAPENPSGRNILYIGKAINIKERIKNHFQQPTYKDDMFIGQTQDIGFINTNSEIEALLLEASLIKKYQPKFNQVWRDDKNYFFVAISGGKKPIVYITHQKKDSKTKYIGPFTEGNALKKTLTFLRKVFPYYTTLTHPKKPCTWCHLDLCPGPDPDLTAYKKNIKKLQLILEGKRKTVLNSLKKEMADFSKQKKFEEALAVRDKIVALEKVMAHANVIVRSDAPISIEAEKTSAILQTLIGSQNPVVKMECYDISNTQGQQAVGSMVVFVNGKPDKNQYKKFRIRMENTPNDIAMLGEVLRRRLRHPEWPYPDVMLIDGGIAQLNIGIKTKSEKPETQHIKIISIAKRFKELYIEGRKNPILLKTLPQEIFNQIIHLDDEAHRFAITYHKKIRKRELLR